MFTRRADGRGNGALLAHLGTWCGLTALAVVSLWAFWPTLRYLVTAWESEPDYSHGYLVVPLAALFAWLRRGSFPGLDNRGRWLGVVLVAASLLLRTGAAMLYMEPVDAWSLIVWVAGVVCLVGGWRVLWWSMPSVVFLFFMVPLPWRVDQMLSRPLQRGATIISTWVLQCFGQPAFDEANTILLGDFRLEVEQACSGLRIFLGIFALAYAMAVMVPSRWWEKALLFVFALPVSIVANVSRVVLTGLLYQWVSGEAARHFGHDLAGWVMILYAALLFALGVWYFNRLLPQVQLVSAAELAKRMAG